MKFSIITAVKNGELYIEDSINSLRMQTFKDYEHIIIDGLSTDNTISILKNYNDSKIKILSDSDVGIYDALNKGINASIGEIIGFLHSDDLYFDAEVLSCVSKLFDDLQVDAVYGDLIFVDKSATSTLRTWKSSNYSREMLFFGWMPPHPTLFVRKNVYFDIGGFNSNFRISGDYDFILRMFGCGIYSTHYIQKTLVKMRVGGISNNSLRNVIKKMREDYLALKLNAVGGLFSLASKNLRKLKQLTFFNKIKHFEN